MKKIILNLKNSLNKLIFPFYNEKNLKEFFNILEQDIDTKLKKDVAMFVGGCVRNHINSKKIKDIDIATIYSPEDLKKKFKNTKFKIVDTGIKHGSVTIICGKNKYEVTTLRKDIKTDGRHAEIKTIDNWKEDSNRRDFTINAIYLSKTGKIFDPQLGLKDLQNNTVKFIGDPQQRIEEDYLRIIRYLRFSIQYNSPSDKSTIQAIKLNLNGIKNLSKERVYGELIKIISLKNFYNLVNNSELKDIFSLIFPEIKYFDRFKKSFLMGPEVLNVNIVNKFAILTVDEKSNHEYFCHKYKLSNEIRKKLKLLADEYSEFKKDKQYFEKNLEKKLFLLGKDTLNILNLLNFSEKKDTNNISANNNSRKYEKIFDKIDKMRIPKFPFNGEYLKEKGLKEGAAIGQTLKLIQNEWLSQNFNISNDRVLEIIKDKKLS